VVVQALTRVFYREQDAEERRLLEGGAASPRRHRPGTRPADSLAPCLRRSTEAPAIRHAGVPFRCPLTT